VSSEVQANAWQQTLDDMWALEADLQDDGWETLVTAAGHTASVTPSHGNGYWGLVHIVPDSDAETIGEAVEAGEFAAYDVYRTDVDGRIFSVTVLMDPESETAVPVSNQFELRKAHALIRHTHEVGYVNPSSGTSMALWSHRFATTTPRSSSPLRDVRRRLRWKGQAGTHPSDFRVPRRTKLILPELLP